MTPTAERAPGSGILQRALRPVGWFWRSPARIVGLVVAVVLSQWALFRADAVFEGIAGVPTLDTQNDLDAATATAQIDAYSGQAVAAYELFLFIDFFFPLLAALLLSGVVFGALTAANRRTRWTVPVWLALACLLPALFDYAENVGWAGAVASSAGPGWIAAGLIAKGLKLAALGLAGVLVAASLVYLLVVVLATWRRSRSASR
ncbi:hypothetical protein ACFUTX_16140 [Microbacterium sp. NPDC057407]|uniref:hypothetical protein n=1 Tax=Microbacterium sp. NPDC057407 TaxID=3346120 RepID=UPI0036719D8C